MDIHENNDAAKRGLREANEQIAAIDEKLEQLLEKYLAGEVSESLVRVQEINLRKRRETFENIRRAMLGAIKHF